MRCGILGSRHCGHEPVFEAVNLWLERRELVFIRPFFLLGTAMSLIPLSYCVNDTYFIMKIRLVSISQVIGTRRGPNSATNEWR